MIFFKPSVYSYHDTLIKGPNLTIMEGLKKSGFQGEFDMLYFDGPFNSGRIFSMPNTRTGVKLVNTWAEAETMEHFLHPSSYIEDYRKRIMVAKELMKDEAILVLQIDQLEAHYIKVMLDEVFGRQNFLAEVIWKVSEHIYPYSYQFGYQHETLLFYSKTDKYQKFNFTFSSIWDDLGYYETLDDENTFYPSQKPEKLIERILQATTKEGDLVGDFYCGSGTFPYVAGKMGRRWIACDHSQHAIKIAGERISKLGIPFIESYVNEEFSPENFKNGVYTKSTFVPISTKELSALDKYTEEEQITVHACEYNPDVDRIHTDKRFVFRMIVPSIDSQGIHVDKPITISRPIPVFNEGKYMLVIENEFEWVLYNILHVELDKEKQNYDFNWDLIQQQIQDVLLAMNNQWVEYIEEKGDFTIITDVFGNKYHLQLEGEGALELTGR